METILTDWKSAIAAPVFNKGDRSRNQASNYRPISLASICCKINEHITNNSTLAHLKQITFSMNNSMSSVLRNSGSDRVDRSSSSKTPPWDDILNWIEEIAQQI
jgi:hypothetical protein